MRIGLVALMHESNTFLRVPTTLDDFRRESLNTGQDIIDRWANAPHEVGGFIEGITCADETPVPIFTSWAMPGGAVAADAFDTMLQMVLDGIDSAGPLDGLLLAPHGAGVSENHLDMDGYWLSVLREKVGPHMPMICTMDPHANLSQEMVDACNASIAYRSNPHLDQRQIGLQAADLMVRTVRGEIRPTQAASFPAMAINIERQTTLEPPCLPMYEVANQMLERPGVLSNSITLGFSFADVPEMGTAFIVVTDDNPDLAQQGVDELADYLWQHREQFVAHLVGIEEAIDTALDSERPVCLLDMGDNVGGGSPGDSTFLAHALDDRSVKRSFICLYDPQSVQQAEEAGAGNRVPLRMGGKTDNLHGGPLERTVTVRGIYDGEYTEPKVRHGGRSWGTMGRTAVVETDNGLTVQLTSLRNAPFSIQHICCCDLDPASFDVLVAKGVIAPTPAFAEVCNTMIRVNTPGVTSADLTHFDYRHRRRPLYPLEQ